MKKEKLNGIVWKKIEVVLVENEIKEIRCKKCNKLFAVIEGANIKIKGKTHANISQGKYEFKCTLCGRKIQGYVKN